MDRKEYLKEYYQRHKKEMSIRHSKRQRSQKGKMAARGYVKQQQQRNKEILHNLKINGCAICGYNECDTALDFHHVIQESKKFNLNIRGMARKDTCLVEELNKCILLCANCHRKIHYEELD